jgi:hypothetical protein
MAKEDIRPGRTTVVQVPRKQSPAPWLKQPLKDCNKRLGVLRFWKHHLVINGLCR